MAWIIIKFRFVHHVHVPSKRPQHRSCDKDCWLIIMRKKNVFCARAPASHHEGQQTLELTVLLSSAREQSNFLEFRCWRSPIVNGTLPRNFDADHIEAAIYHGFTSVHMQRSKIVPYECHRLIHNRRNSKECPNV